MIDRLREVMQRLFWLRPLFMAAGIIGIALFTAELLATPLPGKDDVLLIPSGVLVLWALVGIAGINTFPNVPPKTDAQIGFVRRTVLTLRRLAYSLLATVFLLLSAASIYLTHKLLSIWFNA